MIKNKIGYVVKIYGVVQGVGFRPYIYRKGKELGIKGWVNNCDSTVVISMEGEEKKVKQFLIDIIKKPPKLAKIEKTEVIKKSIEEYENFVIEKSISSKTKLKFILPDIATCHKCVEDIFSRDSRRYRYAFANCTLCGPRYSIIKSLPYDRCNTTMSNFKMCKECREEYENPDTRRFHAQPTCCVDCGPKLILTDNKGNKIKCLDEIKECAKLLKEGKILGIKGIGGFHIVCSALNKKAVLDIRKRKNRKDKPLALMMKDMNEVKKYCNVSEREEEVLLSNKRPIVLLRKSEQENKLKGVAPKIKKYGVMLPYTPIHYLLFNEKVPPLVMTSANVSGSPIEYTNEGALKNICNLVDFFLFNNREINTPVDDSVVKVVEKRVLVSRLGRGYAPYYIDRQIKHDIFACGAEDKSTFSFSLDGIVYMSQYLGDLKELNAYGEYVKSINNITKIFEFNPKVMAYDMHPDYMSTVYGKSMNNAETKVPVQHHHAHMASCMLEHNICDCVIGIIYDGMGLGLDENIWGGEFFIGNKREFKRVAHLKYTKIQGGDSAQKYIWKIGISYLKTLHNKDMINFGLERMMDIPKELIENVSIALDAGLNCYKTSSMGRLYDAVCSILNLRQVINYDAQGAIELENIVEDDVKESYEYFIDIDKDMYILDYSPILIDILEDIKRDVEVSKISARFHNTIVKMTVDMACRLREKFKINMVVLSGGVFENIYLLKNTYLSLKNENFQVYFNENIPINDSGISLGQCAVADEILNEKGV